MKLGPPILQRRKDQTIISLNIRCFYIKIEKNYIDLIALDHQAARIKKNTRELFYKMKRGLFQYIKAWLSLIRPKYLNPLDKGGDFRDINLELNARGVSG